MRLVIADCSVDYAGRLSAHLPLAKRLLVLKGDGSVLIHSETGSYKPLNWMNPPCNISKHEPDEEQLAKGVKEIWRVSQVKTADILWIQIYQIHEEVYHELGKDPGLIKDGVEAHLQELLAAQIELIGAGSKLIRREYATTIGPVDLLAKDSNGQTVAIEIKRRGEIDGVEQLTRYLELLNRDESLSPVRGIFAAQEIKPQARTLAEDRGIECLVLDYEQMKGEAQDPDSLF
ncbi:MAG: endonuclease NucS [Microbacteriaceae bacterium]|nr:endonuclease NucS [Microbacteriaceae bacterium]